MTKHRLIAALFLSSLLGCGPEVESDGAEPATLAQELSAQPKVSLRATASSRAPLRFANRFDLDQVVDLYLIADITTSSGPHEARIEVFMPTGDLYQVSTQAFTAQRKAESRVFATLPVAGTWIQQFSLSGRWTAQVFVDGASAPAASLTFLLK